MSTTEVYNPSKVKKVIGEIESEFSNLSKVIQKTNSSITEALGSPDNAVYGDAGNKILATWDENCSTLNSFMGVFDNWSLMVVSIANEYGELDKGTAKVEKVDLDAFKTIAGANKTDMLNTDIGKKYKGSVSEYTKDGISYKETADLSNKRTVSYTKDNDNITEYYNMGGTDKANMIGYKKGDNYYDANDKSVNKIGLKSELSKDADIKKAIGVLGASVATKQKEKTQRDKERKEMANYLNPANLSGYQLDFVNSLIDGAVKAYKEYGVLPSLTLAQAILESGWGKHRIGNNIFGIKAGSSWNGKTITCRTGEQSPNGARYTITATFRDYDSISDSVKDHAKLLTMDRYRKVLTSKDYKEACYEVRAAGYATSLDYTKNLIRLVEMYGLNQWDPKR